MILQNFRHFSSASASQSNTSRFHARDISALDTRGQPSSFTRISREYHARAGSHSRNMPRDARRAVSRRPQKKKRKVPQRPSSDADRGSPLIPSCVESARAERRIRQRDGAGPRTLSPSGSSGRSSAGETRTRAAQACTPLYAPRRACASPSLWP